MGSLIKSLFERITGKKSTISPEKRLENITGFAKDILERENKTLSRETAIYALIRMLTDKIIIENTVDVIGELKTKIVGERKGLSLDSLMSKDDRDSFRLLWDLVYQEPIKSFSDDIIIDLAKDPIIPSVWERTRLLWSIADIGNHNNPWEQQHINHAIQLYLPIGLSIVTGGNHSITSGMIKRTGKLIINESTNICYVYDISKLLRDIRFDGTYYRKTIDNSIAFKGANFDFGCVFEIGRVILDNNMCFQRLNQKFLE